MRTKLWCGIGLLASIVAGGGSAVAADLAVKAPPAPVACPSAWTGYYLGIHGGYGWGHTSFDFPFGALDGSPKGGVFGGQAGYNWQYCNFVAGLEIDFSGADITQTVSRVEEKTNELASARGRVGYLLFSPNILLYGTAGIALGHSRLSAGGLTANATQVGWVAGAGLEYMIPIGSACCSTQAWILRAEYLHYDLADTAFSFPVVLSPNFSERVDVFRGAVSFKF
jgi:outer membrane immunogenic protein